MFEPSYFNAGELASAGFRSLGSNVLIGRSCHIVGAHNVSIGDNVRIDGFCTLVVPNGGYLTIGNYVHLGGYCALLAAEGIEIADFCTLSWGCKLFTRTDDYSGEFMVNPMVPDELRGVTKGAISLQRHCIVGAGSVVLPHVVMGEGVAVGALSLVTTSLDEWGIYAGQPVTQLKKRSRAATKRAAALSCEPAP